MDYEPPFFKSCSEEEEAHNTWAKRPLQLELGEVNSKHSVLALKARDSIVGYMPEDELISFIFKIFFSLSVFVQIKSVLDPCESDDEMQDDEVSLGADSVETNRVPESDTEVRDSINLIFINFIFYFFVNV